MPERFEVNNSTEQRPCGNWLALAGVLVYLLEFAVFVPAGVSMPAVGDPVVHYAGRDVAFTITAALLSVILLGRIAFMVGLSSALPARQPFAELAVVAMSVSVALEVGSLGMAAAAARVASSGGDPATVAGLDGAVVGLGLGIFSIFGFSVAAAAIAMLQSHAFRGWLGWLGIFAGLAMVGSGTLDAALDTGTAEGGSFGPVAWAAAVVWMLIAAITIGRRARSSDQRGST